MVGSNDRWVFQGVHMLMRMGSSSDFAMGLHHWAKDEKRMNRFCFIGRNLDRNVLQEGIKACTFDGKLPDPGEPPLEALRFAVGDKVKVNVGS